MIHITKISKAYRSSKKVSVNALKEVSLDLRDNGMIAIVGKSGCGKTTLLNLLGTLDKPTSGSITIDDYYGEKNYCVTAQKEKELDAFRNRYLGFIFQNHALIPEWTVKQNIEIALDQQEWKSKSEEELDVRIQQILDYVELEDVSDRYIKELSGGQQQRVAIARAMIKSPKLLLADEPTGNLDTESSNTILRLLKKCSESCLVLMVTHDVESAATYADQIIRIEDGQIKEDIRTENQEIGETIAVDERDGVEHSHLSTKMVCKLAFRTMSVKKLKLLFVVAAVMIVLALGKIAITLLNNDYGKAVANNLKQDNEFVLTTSELLEYKDVIGITAEYKAKNRKEMVEVLKTEFGSTNVYPVLEEVVISSGGQSEEILANLVVGGVNDPQYEMLGTLPSKKNEIVITDCVTYLLGLPDDCIGTSLLVDDQEMIVTGVVILNTREYMQVGADGFTQNDIGKLWYQGGLRMLVSESYFEYARESGKLRLSIASLGETILSSAVEL